MRIRVALALAISSALLLAGGRGGGRYSAPRSYAHKSPAPPKATYKSGNGTRYIAGESYNSGMPKVERSQGTKNEFLRQRGLAKTPPGFQIDHVIPLSKGGADNPQNMQLLPIEVHKMKTAQERK